jgi:hypothetical protein
MKGDAALLTAALCCTALAACQPDDEKASFYAVVSPSKSSAQFSQDVAKLANQNGLTPSLGRATDDKRHTLYVVEATGRWMRLWAQNVPLSGNENPAICGAYVEAHPDPGQFYVTVGPILPLLPLAPSRDLASQLRHEISALGYHVSAEALPLCSSLSKPAS